MYSPCVYYYDSQFGPFSERTEVTTGAGAPEACRPPHIICKSPSCAVVSWDVRITYIIFYFVYADNHRRHAFNYFLFS